MERFFPVALRAARFTLLGFLMICSLTVYAQAVDGGLGEPATSVVVTSTGASTWQGTLLTVAVIAVLGLIAAALGVWIAFTAQKAKDSKGWALVNKASMAAQLAFHTVEAELSPLVKDALKDGTIDAAEMAAIKAKGVEVAKRLVGDGLAGLPAFLGFATGSVGDILTGMISKLASGFATPAAAAPTPVTVNNTISPDTVAPAVPK